MKAINKVVGQKSTVIANLETILEQTVICADEELAELDEKICKFRMNSAPVSYQRREAHASSAYQPVTAAYY